MKIINAPSVYLIGIQELCDTEVERFLKDHDTRWVQPGGEWPEGDNEIAAAEEITEFGGRLCYMSFASPRPGGNPAYLDNIKSSGHGSVLEHAVWNLCITGVSRTLTHELVRHRAGVAYSQLSQRYVDESVAEYVEPDIIASDAELHRIWVEAMANAHECYLELVDKIKDKLKLPEFLSKWASTVPYQGGVNIPKTELTKLARQAARSVLPNATETKILFTANARALRHFLEMRGSRFAEPEIRKLANAILEVAKRESPNIFGDYHSTPLPDGTAEIVTKYRKV